MENEIKKLIEIYKERKNWKVAAYLVVQDLQDLLDFKQKKRCGNKKGILSTLDDVAQYNYSKSQIKQAYDEGYKAGQKSLITAFVQG